MRGAARSSSSGAGSGRRQEKRRRYVRQIHLVRPGAEDVYLVTDLLDEASLSGRGPAGGLPEAVGDRARVPEDHRGLPAGAADRQHAGGDDLPGVVLPGAVQPAAGDARRTWRPARQGLAAETVSMEKLFDDVQKELTALVVLFPSATIAGWFAGEWSREEVVRAAGAAAGRSVEAAVSQGDQQEAAAEGEEGEVFGGSYLGPEAPGCGAARSDENPRAYRSRSRANRWGEAPSEPARRGLGRSLALPKARIL